MKEWNDGGVLNGILFINLGIKIGFIYNWNINVMVYMFMKIFVLIFLVMKCICFMLLEVKWI